MVIGTCVLELYMGGLHSLKGKRQIVKSIKDKIRQRFNVSIAEIEHQDKWQRATLAVAAVANEVKYLDGILTAVVTFIEGLGVAEITDYKIELS